MSNIKRELEAWDWNAEDYRRLRDELLVDCEEELISNTGRQLAENHVNVTQSAGIKHDANKPRMDLLPSESLEEIAKVLAFGATKYTDWNWAKGFKWSRLYGATLRHLYAHMRGEEKDPETGISHLAHAGANVLFLIYHELQKVGEDDRHPRPSEQK